MRISDWSSDVCSSDLPDGDRVVAQAHQDLWTGADDGEAAQVDEEEEGRGVQPAQRAIEREGRQPERQRQALRQHDLKDVAGQDRKSTRLNSSHYCASRMPSSA